MHTPRKYPPPAPPATSGPLRIRPPFECPVCGGEHMEQVHVYNSRGDLKPTQAYQCSHCTVMFRDRDKFTRHRAMAVSAEDLSKPAPYRRRG